VNRNLFRAFVRAKEISPCWKHCQLRSCTIQRPALRLRETLHIPRVHRFAGRDRYILRLLIMTDRAPDQPEDNLPGGNRQSLADYLWKIVGVAALVISVWLLSRELRSLSFAEIGTKLALLPTGTWIGSGLSALVAYALLGFYDRLALTYLDRKVSPLFAHACAAATYAFAHVVGASVFSGAVIRYRAYSSKGLTGREIAALVAFCAFTFALGVVTVMGTVLVAQPSIVDRFLGRLPIEVSSGAGMILLGFVALFLLISLLPKTSLGVRLTVINYPPFPIAAGQIVVSSAEIIAATLIIYLALPTTSNPGLSIVAGVFVFSFAAAIASHSPGGLGVFELGFITGLPELPEADVLAALLVFRLFYFVLPFVFSLGAISVFELRRKR